jgi:hypothetical protein
MEMFKGLSYAVLCVRLGQVDTAFTAGGSS